jgi:hypothetical protein
MVVLVMATVLIVYTAYAAAPLFAGIYRMICSIFTRFSQALAINNTV